MLLRGAAALAVALALAACATAAPPAEDEGPDTCGRAAHAHLLGANAADIDPSSLPEGSRILLPGAPVTADYRAERLNLWVNEDGRVEALRCF